MPEVRIPVRRCIYWRLDGFPDRPVVTAYGLNGLVRLNEIASLIWLLMDGSHSREDIEAKLRQRFPQVPPCRLKEDLDHFLRRAENRGLVVGSCDPLQPYEVLCERISP